MKNIKIFVSHRIDIESFQVPNQLFVNILCGAFRPHKDIGLIGDNTGDNISEQQPFFSELTVQYWAWKNQEADYYGLCHYRRYFSFSDKRYPTSTANFICEPLLNNHAVKNFKLNDTKLIENLMDNFDCLIPEPSDARNWIPQNGNPIPQNIRELWIYFENVYEKDIDILTSIIDRKFPEYTPIYKEYFAQIKHRGYNVFLMKKQLFFSMCDFQFTILDEFRKIVDAKLYEDSNKRRVYGYMAELLFGIFTYKMEKEQKYRIKSLQCVLFLHTEKKLTIKKAIYIGLYRFYEIFFPFKTNKFFVILKKFIIKSNIAKWLKK